MTDFYKFQVENEKAKPGHAKVIFLDVKERGVPVFETYDVTSAGGTREDFSRWAKKEFGYLRIKETFPMMGNRWVQSSIIFGLAVGLWLGGWIAALIDPVACLVIPIPIAVFGTLVLNKARGTDGWGGPYQGPPNR